MWCIGALARHASRSLVIATSWELWADIVLRQWVPRPNKRTKCKFPAYSPPYFSIIFRAFCVKIPKTLGKEEKPNSIIVLNVLTTSPGHKWPEPTYSGFRALTGSEREDLNQRHLKGKNITYTCLSKLRNSFSFSRVFVLSEILEPLHYFLDGHVRKPKLRKVSFPGTCKLFYLLMQHPFHWSYKLSLEF